MLRIVGLGCAALLGVGGVGVYKASNAGNGLNFSMLPHHSPCVFPEINLRSLVVTMMLADELDSEEVEILTNSVEFIYNPWNNPCIPKRRYWCSAEVKNFMKCAQTHGNFQDCRCKVYKGMLRACLSSRKDAEAIIPTKSVEELYESAGCPKTLACQKSRVALQPPVVPEVAKVATSKPRPVHSQVPRPALCPAHSQAHSQACPFHSQAPFPAPQNAPRQAQIQVPCADTSQADPCADPCCEQEVPSLTATSVIYKSSKTVQVDSPSFTDPIASAAAAADNLLCGSPIEQLCPEDCKDPCNSSEDNFETEDQCSPITPTPPKTNGADSCNSKDENSNMAQKTEISTQTDPVNLDFGLSGVNFNLNYDEWARDQRNKFCAS